MKSLTYRGLECVLLENDRLQLLVPRSIGPRILSLRFQRGENLLAEQPGFVTTRPDGKTYHFYGGHRLWLSPEDPIRSYGLDDWPVEISAEGDSLLIRKTVEVETGIEKSILLSMPAGEAKLRLTHRLANLGQEPVECAPWAITQLRLGGLAILPQVQTNTGLLPNRLISLWPYSDIASPQLSLGRHFILLRAGEQPPFKIGFPNPRGWLAYWLDGNLFVKRTSYDPRARYSDFGSSSECYCNQHFLELETLAPLTWIAPGESITHLETWELFPDISFPADEKTMLAIADEFGLE